MIWTDAEIMMLHGKMTSAEIGRRLGLTGSAVRHRRRRLGLETQWPTKSGPRKSGVEPRDFSVKVEPHRGAFAPLMEAWQ